MTTQAGDWRDIPFLEGRWLFLKDLQHDDCVPGFCAVLSRNRTTPRVSPRGPRQGRTPQISGEAKTNQIMTENPILSDLATA